MTPGGPLPASHVHPVPKGGSIDIVLNEIHLLDAAKNVVHVAQVNNTELSGWQDGYIAYAAWLNTHASSSQISYFNTTLGRSHLLQLPIMDSLSTYTPVWSLRIMVLFCNLYSNMAFHQQAVVHIGPLLIGM